mgnify:CR=1 FL=1
MAVLEAQELKKRYELGEHGVDALAGLDFTVQEGEFVAIMGPSGSGKSTLLNIIAGLVNPDYGEISWNGESLSGLPTYKRGFGLMFQDFALFPHKNVAGNVAFGQHMQPGRLELLAADGIEARMRHVKPGVDVVHERVC